MDKFKIGEIVEGTVTGIERYGIFLSFNNNKTGLIHISEISDKYIKNIYEYTSMNKKIKAIIIGYDIDKNHLKLSLKRMVKQKSCIKETKKGFTTLEKNLNHWIEEKLMEIK